MLGPTHMKQSKSTALMRDENENKRIEKQQNGMEAALKCINKNTNKIERIIC